jgi:selenocysteine-specific elongation factor
MHVVATAGHVDHGKSTLVRALTGTDPDRLEEERRRGLTIELGYAWTELAGAGTVAFVDVPGHERFISTALAGFGPVPVVLLVVAADDPWMPQAAEHLAALDALDVRHGVLVVTRADRADPRGALTRARAEVDATSLRGIPSVVVSGHTGEGLDELRASLARVLQDLPAPSSAADVRLWIDRAFHVHGTGRVVTGTLPSGTVAVGDLLEAAEGTVLRVRGVQSLGRPREQVSGPARVALALTGSGADSVARGDVIVAPGSHLRSELVDVALRGPESMPREPVLHVGTTHLGVHLRPLGTDFARLGLDRALPLRVGDRALLRDPGTRKVWGLEVKDLSPPALLRRGAADIRARDLATLDGSLAAELRLRGVVRRDDLRAMGVEVGPVPEGVVQADGWLVSPERARSLRADLRALVAEADRKGITAEVAARRLSLPTAGLVERLLTDPLRMSDGRVVDAGTAAVVSLPTELEAARDQLRDALARDPFAAPDAGTLRDMGLDKAAVAVLHRAGEVLRVGEGVVLLPGADDAAVTVLAGLPQPFTTSQARQALGTSRRVALPLLAHLDATGRTVRLADDTRRLRRT